MRKTILIVTVLLFTAFIFESLSAYPGGITGRTRKTSTAGCGTCHSQGTTITGAITGPDTVVAGQTYTFILTLTTTGGSGKYGVDIAANRGTLAPISGQGLVLSSTELIHSSAITWVSPKTITFSYIAPATPGRDTLFATVARGYSGAYNWAPDRNIFIKLGTNIEKISNIADKYSLNQNFPNPFNPATKITFSIAKTSKVSLKIYNALGKEAANLVNSQYGEGTYSVDWNAVNYSSGVYFYTITANDFTETKRMLLVK